VAKTYKKRAEEIWELAEEEGKIHYDIGYRGGGIGINSRWLAFEIGGFVNEDYDPYYLEARLPRYFGAGCNYLGGGVRGAIFSSDFDDAIWEEYPKIAKLLYEIGKLVVKKYKEAEDSLNLEEYDIWGVEATERARQLGIVSAY